MSTKNTYWIKFYTGLLDNPKFLKLSDATKWHYAGLYLLAKKAEAGGWLTYDSQILSSDDMAFALRVDSEILSNSLDTLVSNGFIKTELVNEKTVYIIASYEDEQSLDGDSEIIQRRREADRIRQQNHRAKVYSQTSEEEKNRIEKNRIEKKRKEQSRDCHVTEDFSSFSLKDNPNILEQMQADFQKRFGKKVIDEKWIPVLEKIYLDVNQRGCKFSRFEKLVQEYKQDGFDIVKANPAKVLEIWDESIWMVKNEYHEPKPIESEDTLSEEEYRKNYLNFGKRTNNLPLVECEGVNNG